MEIQIIIIIVDISVRKLFLISILNIEDHCYRLDNSGECLTGTCQKLISLGFFIAFVLDMDLGNMSLS